MQPYEIIGPQPAIDWFGSLSWRHWRKPGWWVQLSTPSARGYVPMPMQEGRRHRNWVGLSV